MADCNQCPSKNSCSSQQKENCEKSEFFIAQNSMSDIKRVIPVVSGKGGVGKSSITAMLAVLMSRKGYRTAILDADVTGPSIPKMFGLKAGILGDESGIYPAKTHNNISVMSVNLLLQQEDQPVVWRGPIISGTVKQFWTDVIWEDIDYMFIDMPPGTGDVPLTIFQSLPVDGIIIATSPQELVSVIVKKAVNMAAKMNIEIAGVVENMSYVLCPDCGKKIDVFGAGKVEETASALGLEVLGKIPMDLDISRLCDNGEIEKFNSGYLDHCVEVLEKKYPV